MTSDKLSVWVSSEQAAGVVKSGAVTVDRGEVYAGVS